MRPASCVSSIISRTAKPHCLLDFLIYVYMCLRAHTISRISNSLASTSTSISTSSTYRPLRHITNQSHLRLTANTRTSPSSSRQTYEYRHQSAYKRGGTGLYATVVVIGIAIGGPLLFSLVKDGSKKDTGDHTSLSSFEYSDWTDSYLVMAPNTPPGRPGTLTPEQEVKLRELWVVTMKVFGVYEPLSTEPNGSETLSTAPTTKIPAAENVGKREKKKSRLHVFKRNKADKGAESDPSPPSGTATPSDMSALSIADEDDKHGQAKVFKAALANTAPEDLRQAFWSMVKHDHPDGLLLRFLRARKWDVEKALVMMISTMHWRLEDMHVEDDIVLKGEMAALNDSKSDDPKMKKEGEDFLAQMRMGKSFLHGLDKDGRPMCIVRARLHKQGEQSEKSLERFTVHTIETARMLLRPPVDTATIVFDMTGFSMANMDYTPVKFMIKCFEANYPESLGTVLVYKAPWIFNAIWSIIRGWLDPVVAGKVHFAKTIDELTKFVPSSQIPVDLDGEEKWEYTYVEPEEGENEKLKETAKRDEIQATRTGLVRRYEATVLDWIHAGEAATADTSLEERRRERDTIAEELRANYWTLDPYVRARTLYDRMGLIGDSGKLDLYLTTKKENVTTVAVAVPAQDTRKDDLD